jgi:hypothetical protein
MKGPTSPTSTQSNYIFIIHGNPSDSPSPMTHWVAHAFLQNYQQSSFYHFWIKTLQSLPQNILQNVPNMTYAWNYVNDTLHSIEWSVNELNTWRGYINRVSQLNELTNTQNKCYISLNSPFLMLNWYKI